MKILFLVMFLFLPMPVVAAELADGWTETGSVEMTLDGEAQTLVVARHPDARAFVTRRETGGLVTINAAAAGLNANGQPDAPFASFTLGPYSGDTLPSEAWFQFYTSDSILAADIDTGSSVALSEATLSDSGVLSFAFEGVAMPVENKDGMLSPIEGASPVTIAGRFTGQIDE